MRASFIPILFTMFIVVDPVGLVPLYISMTAGFDAGIRNRIILKAVSTAFLVLVLFILAGQWILRLLGVRPGSFFIAGGIMLFIVSLEMLFGQATRTKTSKREAPADREGESEVAVFPLAIPMLAGPGTITTILLFTSSPASPVSTMLQLAGAVVLTLLAAAAAMKSSELLLRALGRTGVSVIERIMGLLLSGLSVQFVYDGLTQLGLLGKGIL